MGRRETNRGLFLLRRSGDRQESSLDKQLTWAAAKAQSEGVTVNAAPADLAHMRGAKLHSYKSIRLDDAIPGDELDRPGLTALIRDVVADRTISHVFVFARDRLGRPASPVDSMAKELELLRAGVTIVYPDDRLELPPGGQLGIADEIKMLLDYRMSGEQPRKLAEQMINTQRLLAEQGRSVGGNAPYGFVRALVNAKDEIQEYLVKGKRVRQPGCHVVWVPDPNDDGTGEQSKLRVWVMMLTLKEEGWGYKRIANHLNELRIPSPAAGEHRTDGGERHMIDGFWSHTTVKAILENRTILAILDYGRRSEGKHRRLGPGGPRFVEDRDRNAAGRPKVIRNDESLVVSRPLPFEAKFDAVRWEQIRAETRRRGRSQAGIPRVREPERYPLSCRVIDLTDGCGSVMYARTSGGRSLYTCGRYMKGGGAACANNQVDGEAMLRFTLSTLKELVTRAGARDALRRRLLALARGESEGAGRPEASIRRVALEAAIQKLERRRQTVGRNALQAEDADLRAEAESMFKEIKGELDAVRRQLATLDSLEAGRRDPEREVERAMALFDDVHRVADNPAARADVARLMNQLGVLIGLKFVEGVKGKKRRVRILASGVMHSGDAPPGGGGQKAQVPPEGAAPEINCDGRSGKESPESATRPTKCPGEGISSTKVNRGERI